MDLAPSPAALGWLYLPTAIALGALHGLEPGHSKTMIVSFLVAIRGTIRQAVLLGVSAALSHTAVIWVLAFLAISLRDRFDLAHAEPWLQALSGVTVLAMALWMGVRTWRGSRRPAQGHSHDHGHQHDHGHGHPHSHEHDHSHAHEEAEEEDAHARAHAAQIRKQLANGPVTTPQVVLFGLTGGLTPCPSALAVLLLCLQARQAALGMGIVVAFSVGLALTLVAVGVAAAWSLGRASSRWPGLTAVAARAPYFSAAVLGLVGCYLLVHGLRGI